MKHLKIDTFRYLDSDNDGICYRTYPGTPEGAYLLEELHMTIC